MSGRSGLLRYARNDGLNIVANGMTYRTDATDADCLARSRLAAEGGSPRQALEVAVLAFVIRELPRPIFPWLFRLPPITLKSEFERDIHFMWEDVEEFLIDFFKIFEIDDTDFVFDRYIYAPRPWFRFKKWPPRPKRVPLTIRMLVDSAEAKRWPKHEDGTP